MSEGSALYLRVSRVHQLVMRGWTTFRAFFAQGQKLVKALQHVLEAYVLFDADASGTIDRDEVLNIIAEKGAKKRGGASGLLSKERWAELDWDSDGQITFVEFLYAFEAWVGVDEDESDEEDTTVLAGSVSAALGQPGVGGAAAAASGTDHLPVDDVSLTTGSGAASLQNTPLGTSSEAAEIVAANTAANKQI